MKNIVGRNQEVNYLTDIWQSKEAEFVAVYGRRRVGKTHLIREYFSKKGVYFELTGLKDGSLKDQLINFRDTFSQLFYPNLTLEVPKSWRDAFILLTTEIEKIAKNKKIIIFLDELPWLATKRSNLIQNLDYFWNTKWSKHANLKLIVCGSAASWMIENLIHAKGGLYNRITNSLLLKPYNLEKTKQFLESKGITWKNKQILDLYMIVGGIPYYLNQIKRSKSVSQNINDLCFREDGLLYNEFSRLFKSLFGDDGIYLELVRTIASNRYGVSNDKVIKHLGITSGGRLTDRLEELAAAGFIQRFIPYGHKLRNYYYRIIDEYTLFYLQWIEPFKQQTIIPSDSNYFNTISLSPKWHNWTGYAFENICYKHVNKVAKSLGLNSILYKIGSWRYTVAKGKKENGTQIDLLFDRADNIITLCEIKYSSKKFIIDKSYALNLANKIQTFEKNFTHKKQIMFALITTNGLQQNIWSEDLIDTSLSIEDLF